MSVPGFERFEAHVDGRPIVWQRAGRAASGASYTPRRVAEHQRLLRDYVALRWGRTPLRCPVGMSILFAMPDMRRPDVDNLAKCVLDAMNGVLYEDDRQVEMLHVVRTLGNKKPKTGLRLMWERVLDVPVDD